MPSSDLYTGLGLGSTPVADWLASQAQPLAAPLNQAPYPGYGEPPVGTQQDPETVTVEAKHPPSLDDPYDKQLVRNIVYSMEGGENNYSDPGGGSKWGVELNEYKKFFDKPNATLDDIRPEEAEYFFLSHPDYVSGVKAMGLPRDLEAQAIDVAVNQGIGKVKKFLVNGMNTTADEFAAARAAAYKELWNNPPPKLAAEKAANPNYQPIKSWLYRTEQALEWGKKALKETTVEPALESWINKAKGAIEGNGAQAVAPAPGDGLQGQTGFSTTPAGPSPISNLATQDLLANARILGNWTADKATRLGNSLGESWRTGNELWPEENGYVQPEAGLGGLVPLRARADAKGNPVPGTNELAWPAAAHGAVNALSDLLVTPGRAALGQIDLNDLPDRAAKMGVEMAGLGLGVGAVAPVEGDFAPMFVRPGNKKLAGFYSAESKNPSATAEDLWSQTGVFRGAEQSPRAEIEDSGAGFRDKVPIVGSGAGAKVALPSDKVGKLSDVLDHPDLYQQYPELKNLKIQGPDDWMQQNPGVKASYDPDTQTVYLGKSNPTEALSYLLHEVQHHIQETEGWATGGSLYDFLPPDFPDVYKEAKNTVASVQGKFASAGMNTDHLREIDRHLANGASPDELSLLPKYKKVFDIADANPNLAWEYEDAKGKVGSLDQARNEAYEKYDALAGEVEARTTQERHASGDYQSAPWANPEYPSGPQIVQQGGLGQKTSIVAPTGTGQRAFVPVDHDPFGLGGQQSGHSAKYQFEPVEHNPFVGALQ